MATDYGTDLRCWDDLDPAARDLSGPDLVAQDVYHALRSPPGSVLENEDGTVDVRSFLQDRITPSSLATMSARIASVLSLDERLSDVRCTVVANVDGSKLTATISGRLAEGPFQWVFAITKDTVTRILS